MKLKKHTIWIALIIILTVIILVYVTSKHTSSYQVINGKLFYSSYKGDALFARTIFNQTSIVQTDKISFVSRPFLNRSVTIYALLFMPAQHTKPLPAVIFLPGAGVTKEATSAISTRIALQGYAVLVLDQRGIGQTGGTIPSIEQDYAFFKQGYEPMQHLWVFDALKAFDILQHIPEVDKTKIAIMGESMGGRYALIAAALEPQLKGAILISSAGYNIPLQSEDPAHLFLKSIDPDTYASMISPRPLYMMHGDKDTVIPISSAQHTFFLAQEPKEFFTAEGCAHGLCTQMEPVLYTYLQKLFA